MKVHILARYVESLPREFYLSILCRGPRSLKCKLRGVMCTFRVVEARGDEHMSLNDLGEIGCFRVSKAGFSVFEGIFV